MPTTFSVGSIHAAFDPELKTDQPWALKSECGMASTCSRRSFHYHEKSFGADQVELRRGQEFGHFEVRQAGSFSSRTYCTFAAWL